MTSAKTGSVRKSRGNPQPVVDDPQVTVGIPTTSVAVHPAMHFDRVTGTAYFGFSLPVTVTTKENTTQTDTPCLVTTGMAIPCLPSQLGPHNITLAAEPEWSPCTQNRISIDLLDAILKGDKKSMRALVLSVPEYFTTFVSNNRELVWHPEERWHEYLALWTFGTYVFPLFDTYPQILLWGPKRSAKTKIMTVIKYLGFNAELSPSLSPSSLFRTIESCRATLLLDEMEKIGDKNLFYDLRSLLLSGYKRDGMVKRTEPNGVGKFRQQRYQVYSPKAIANIDGIDDTLQDRCVTINTRRLSGKRLPKHLRKITNRRATTKARMDLYQKVRDSCYVAALDHWQTIDALVQQAEREDDEDEVTARNLELWQPILVLARFFESFSAEEPSLDGLEQRMRDLLIQVIEEHRLMESDSNEHTFIRVLWKMVFDLSDSDEITVSYKELREEWTRGIEGIEDDLEGVSVPNWMEGRKIGDMLKKLGFSSESMKRRGRGMYVSISRKVIEGLVEFFDVDVPDEEILTRQALSKPTLATFDTFATPEEAQDGVGSVGSVGGVGSKRASTAQKSADCDTPPSPDIHEDSARAENEIYPPRVGGENSPPSNDGLGKPPLTEDCLILLLSERSWTSSALRDEVVKHGYQREEFDPIFTKLKEHPNMVVRGQTPIYWKWKK